MITGDYLSDGEIQQVFIILERVVARLFQERQFGECFGPRFGLGSRCPFGFLRRYLGIRRTAKSRRRRLCFPADALDLIKQDSTRARLAQFLKHLLINLESDAALSDFSGNVTLREPTSDRLLEQLDDLFF